MPLNNLELEVRGAAFSEGRNSNSEVNLIKKVCVEKIVGISISNYSDRSIIYMLASSLTHLARYGNL